MTDLSTLLPALASRQQAASGLAAKQSGNGAVPTSPGSGNAGQAAAGASSTSPVSLSRSGLDLSAQGLAERAADLGNATIDMAQSFIGDFARQLFGDAANGATLSFDAASLESESSYTSALRRSLTSGANGLANVRDSAAFSLNDSAHFLGKGTLTTADGQRFAFEVEVSYTSSIEAAASSEQAQAATDDDSGAADLPTVQLPDLEFPGTLSDLFKLLGRQLSADLSAGQDQQQDQEQSQSAVQDQSSSNNNSNSGIQGQGSSSDSIGRLSLRMLTLVNSSTLLGSANTNAATPAGNAETALTAEADAQKRAKALSDAYAAPAQKTAATPPPSTDPAAATR
jgi:hypothetical protein